MPHKAYGIEWPIYQEPKTKVDGRATAFTLPTPQRTLIDTALYWPPEALPFAYVWAFINIALLRSPVANAAYYEAVKALDMLNIKIWIDGSNVEITGTIPVEDSEVVTTLS